MGYGRVRAVTKGEESAAVWVSAMYAAPRHPPLMPALVLIIAFTVLAGGACAIFFAVHRHRTPPELRGDWWSRFEGEFRVYARQSARRDRDRRDRPDRRPHRGELA